MFSDENKNTENLMHGQRMDKHMGMKDGLQKDKGMKAQDKNKFSDENKFTSNQMPKDAMKDQGINLNKAGKPKGKSMQEKEQLPSFQEKIINASIVSGEQPPAGMTKIQGMKNKGMKDMGMKDQGMKDIGMKDIGMKDKGTKDVGMKDQGVKDMGMKDKGMKDNLHMGTDKLHDKPGMMGEQKPLQHSNDLPSTEQHQEHGKKGQKGHKGDKAEGETRDSANWFNKRATRPF